MRKSNIYYFKEGYLGKEAAWVSSVGIEDFMDPDPLAFRPASGWITMAKSSGKAHRSSPRKFKDSDRRDAESQGADMPLLSQATGEGLGQKM
jgi:hypothetical protein